MTTYDLFLESGPKRRKTMVHVLALLGCVAVGPTTDAALAATPEAIHAYMRFLLRLGEDVDPEEAIATRVAEHVSEGYFLGNGSPNVLFGPDLEPLTDGEVARLLRRFTGMSDELASWAATQSDTALDAIPPAGGRPTREVLRHVLAARGSYLSAALGGSQGIGRIATAAERGEVSLPVAFAESAERLMAVVMAATPRQRANPRQLPSGPKTFRQALRRLLEHEWEHLAELSRRPGGPAG